MDTSKQFKYLETMNYLFITNVFNLKIEGDLGDGINLFHGIKITNNKAFIKTLLSQNLLEVIGQLEFNAILNADVILYSINSQNVTGDNIDEITCNNLAYCKMFLTDLWLVKDNCADIMMGFIQYPFYNEMKIILLDSPIIHSNLMSSSYSNSKGSSQEITVFKVEDFNKVVERYANDNIVRMNFTESSEKKSLLEKGIQRITIGVLFLQTARSQSDLGIKISQYCSALEALFSSDNTELTHKLSERIAYFLEKDKNKRLLLFKQIKDIYTIRSQVVHGSAITKKYNDLTRISESADTILRRIFLKLIENPNLDVYFRKNNTELFNNYMTNLIFDICDE